MTTLLVASTGGHLDELFSLAGRLDPDDERMWVTFDSEQSRVLLKGEEVCFAPYSSSRDLLGTARDWFYARRLLSGQHFERVVSTGASIAVAFLPLAQRHGSSVHYIESATRPIGPSLSGRILKSIGVRNLYTQYPTWADTDWLYRGSIFDDFAPTESPGFPQQLDKIVVTLGTHRQYGFRAAIESMLRVLPSSAEILWQTGCTDVSGLMIDARQQVPMKELSETMREADLVVCHAGVGSTLMALQAGKVPLVLPRRKHRNEHVDDHQLELANYLGALGLVVPRDAGEVNDEAVVQAAGRRVIHAGKRPAFVLTT